MALEDMTLKQPAGEAEVPTEFEQRVNALVATEGPVYRKLLELLGNSFVENGLMQYLWIETKGGTRVVTPSMIDTYYNSVD
jgi:hypothetical protein